jgi:hypothetical protein
VREKRRWLIGRSACATRTAPDGADGIGVMATPEREKASNRMGAAVA